MTNNLHKLYRNLFELGKVRVTSFVAISGSVGYVLAKGSIDFDLLLATLGILILSIGGAAFNNIQEINTDALMNRTKSRPLPTNRMSKKQAILWASIFLYGGMLLLYFIFGLQTLILGFATFVAYNLIYTPLKKHTLLAVIPGAISGVLPPIIGWSAGNGSLQDPKILALSIFFFIWQIPHTWFVMLIYDNDYRQAGFPTPSKYLTEEQLKKITYIGVATLASSCMLIPYLGGTNSIVTNILLLLAGFVIVWRTRSLVIKYDKSFNLKHAFLDINLYVLSVVILLMIDKFV
ncbi:MAG TPA: protoheme IX farnesyltransferase [Candidatus Kapabacteria bacterium]|nr:protoheme IX farnesyltransferase [Candidatus Kapabacteria bacterium]